jgi:phenylalanyl-tRNA synthetase beta chain
LKVPLSWLKEYVEIDVPVHELARRMSVSVCHVERVVTRGVPDQDGNLGLYRVGRVLEAGKHPNADRLQLCRVDVGESEPRQIVCGAWNFGAGATVAVALPGAVLPGGRRLEQATLRGQISDGMILSERELELGPDHTGILVLEEPHVPGTPLADVLPLGEVVLELEITPNRPDMLAVYGVAREVAALYGTELASPPGLEPKRVADDELDISVADPDGCPRYIGRIFRGVRVAPSPAWLRVRLAAAGMRPISNVVDVTNYVMHALGNPLHAFDETKLIGQRIVVRRARRGESIRTIDGTRRKLEPADLVIADTDRPVAIAGIMGSIDTEVDDTTTNVLLEAANFEPITILKSSERLGLRTEGSNRWEKGVDPYLAGPAAKLATQLIVELTGGRWAGEKDVAASLPEPPAITLRPERNDALVGLVTPPVEQRRILERLGFEFGGSWTASVPTWRVRDVTREIDLTEEIARFRLEAVPFTLPRRSVMYGRLRKEQRLRRLVEDVLVGAGFSEAYTPSLVADDADPIALRIPMPISSEYAVLRTSLLPSLVEVAERNLAAGNEALAFFEIARVYLPSGEKLPDERWHVAGLLEDGFFRAKGVVEAVHSALKLEPRVEPAHDERYFHPAKAARVEAGRFGELHPSLLEGVWGAFELDLDLLVSRAPERIEFEDVVSYPAVRQDLAFVVDEMISAAELVDAAREAAGPELREMRVFDVYRGEPIPPGKKSLAFRVAFQSPEGTLSDEDAARLRDRIVLTLAQRFGAELRA